MRVVHIGYFYGENGTGGAAIAATRIHRSLRSNGVDSIFVCFENRTTEREGVVEWPARGTIKRRIVSFASRLSRKFTKCVLKENCGTLNIVRTGVVKLLRQLNPDIVHIHWIIDECGSFEELAGIGCAVVVHLHDLQLINATKPYPFGDARYIEGYNCRNSSLYERFLFARKRRLITRTRAVIIGPSEWVSSQSLCSIIGKGHVNSHVPYFQDPIFSYHPEMRKSCKKFVILFGACGGRSNPVKGFAELQEAILNLPIQVQENCQLMIFGEDAPSLYLGRVEVRFAGVARSAMQMLTVYHQADVFAFPSKAETWGQTKSEALLCGIPVVCFDRTACAEGVEHAVTGWIAKKDSVKQFSEGILNFYYRWLSGGLDHELIARLSARRFDNGVIFNLLMNQYRKCER